MTFDRDMAQTRFGYGRAPWAVGPDSVSAMMVALKGPDEAARRFPIPQSDVMKDKANWLAATRRAYTKTEKDSAERQALKRAYRVARREAREEVALWAGRTFARRVWTEDGLRERLVAFWADHFSAPGKNELYRYGASSYVESAIRPYVSARFEDMLIAAALHPQMLFYLDQTTSIGPNSRFAKRRPEKGLGLNENLARELLELHSLGVNGTYTQKDVRQLAELLTGVTGSPRAGTNYVTKFTEPGAETVLGKDYGTRRSRIEDVHEVLRDLARHPDTARHIARKLAVHFVSDTPSEGLVMEVALRYLETDGDLAAVTEALLRHPDAWRPVQDGMGNFKQPELFVCSALRALAVPAAQFEAIKSKDLDRFVGTPLRNMGQPWRRPLGPDGFEEADAHWLSAQGMAARLQWALGAPAAALESLPDPREFVQTTLGPKAPAAVRFAAKAAENRREGIALVLMSPAFQRV